MGPQALATAALRQQERAPGHSSGVVAYAYSKPDRKDTTVMFWDQVRRVVVLLLLLLTLLTFFSPFSTHLDFVLGTPSFHSIIPYSTLSPTFLTSFAALICTT